MTRLDWESRRRAELPKAAASRVYDLDSNLDFGKYRGRSLEDILDEDPAYLLWALATVVRFQVDDALQDAIVRAARSAA